MYGGVCVYNSMDYTKMLCNGFTSYLFKTSSFFMFSLSISKYEMKCKAFFGLSFLALNNLSRML